MRNLIYVLADGTFVKTYKEAEKSGQSYKIVLENAEYSRPVAKKGVKIKKHTPIKYDDFYSYSKRYKEMVNKYKENHSN